MQEPNVLLLEDAAETAELVRLALNPSYQVHWVRTVSEALKESHARRIDIALIDILLEKENGFDFAKSLREHARLKDIPFLFLTAQAGTEDKLKGFQLGADDYITKPFDDQELLIRIGARIQNHRRALENRETIVRGSLRIEIPFQRAVLETPTGQEVLDLKPTEFKLLYLLVKNEPEIVHRNEILHYVWGDSIHVLPRTIDTHVYTLRKKLGAFGSWVKAVPGIGYRFNSEPGDA